MRKGKLKQNIVANLASSAGSAIANLVFVPVYLHYLGIENFGIIGFYVALSAVLRFLDAGVTAALTRELARRTGSGEVSKLGNLTRTLELCSLLTMFLVGSCLWLFGPDIGLLWLKSRSVGPLEMMRCMEVIALLIALQFPQSLYLGGLNGLEDQVFASTASAVAVILKGLASTVTLMFISKTVLGIFVAQFAVNGLFMIVLRARLWRVVKSICRNTPAIDCGEIRSIWRYASGVLCTSVLAVLITQSDKLVISTRFSLDSLGIYTIAGAIANSIYYLSIPINTACFPAFSFSAGCGDVAALKQRYHQVCQTLSTLVWPVAATLVLFAHSILLQWTQNREVAQRAAPIVQLLVLGTALNTMIGPPYQLQLAFGWTRLHLSVALMSAGLLLPALWLFTGWYGPPGAALCWCLNSIIFFIVEIHFMHQRLLREERMKWYFEDVLRPASVAFGIAGIVSLAGHRTSSSWATAAVIGTGFSFAFLLTALSSPAMRQVLATSVETFRAKYVVTLN